MDVSLDKNFSGKPRTSSNIAWHRPMSAWARQDEELMQRSARALATATDPLDKLRLLCFSRGSSGTLALGRIFRRMDGGSRKLNKEQFMDGIKETGVELSDEDAEALFAQFDKEKTGTINIDEFLDHLRPPISDGRRALVEQVFKKLDRTGDGAITIADIRKAYSVDAHPTYISGEDSAEMLMNKFLANFDPECRLDGKVTYEEFMDYYSSISVSIDDDCLFDLIMRQDYKL